MKTQRRNFVVELKSGRKRTTVGPGSIWNGTDLKEIAREAVAQAPHLFDVEPVAKHSDEVRDFPPSLATAILLSDEGGSDDSPTTSLPAKVEQIGHEEDDVSLIVELVSQPVMSTLIQHVDPLNRQRKTRNKRRYPRREDSGVDLPIVSKVGTQVDDLTALEEENGRLRALWKSHLQAQNMQIRQMLERFDIT